MFLRNAWYVAGWERDVGEAPYAATILGDRVAIYRGASGVAGEIGHLRRVLVSRVEIVAGDHHVERSRRSEVDEEAEEAAGTQHNRRARDLSHQRAHRVHDLELRAAANDLLAVLHEELEEKLPALGGLWPLADAETGETTLIDLSDLRTRRAYEARAKEREEKRERVFRHLSLDAVRVRPGATTNASKRASRPSASVSSSGWKNVPSITPS